MKNKLHFKFFKNRQNPFCHIILYNFERMFLPVKETNSKLLFD